MAAHYEHALLSLVRHCRSANEIWLFHVISKRNMTDVTLTFAYMTVSYLAGSRLSTFQASVLSGPCVLSAGCVILAMYMLVLTWGAVRAGVCGGIAAAGCNRLQSVF